MGSKGSVGISLLGAAQSARSQASRLNILSRARNRANLWAWLLADWPALVEFARDELHEIEALVFRQQP